MKLRSPSGNLILLFWMAIGCLAIGFARDENSAFKKKLRDLNTPMLSILAPIHRGFEESCQSLFLLAEITLGNDSQGDLALEDQKLLLETSRLKREVLALQELLAARKRSKKSSQPTARLFAPKMIAAQILLPDQQRQWKTGAMIDAGSSQKIREQDWIVSAELPLIDLGEDFGLQPDQILLSGCVIVGQINAVGRWSSSYRSVNDSNFRCPATVIKSEASSSHSTQNSVQRIEAIGSLHGTEDELCELRYIENTHPIRVGDLVVLADEQQRFEGSLVLGTITVAEVLPNSPFWKIMVRPEKITKPTRDVLVITEELNPLRLLGN